MIHGWIDDVDKANKKIERLEALAAKSGLRRYGDVETRTALCVGGPEHGRSMTVRGSWFAVAKAPDVSFVVPSSDQTEFLRFIEGRYVLHLIDAAESQPLYVWAWQGWDS